MWLKGCNYPKSLVKIVLRIVLLSDTSCCIVITALTLPAATSPRLSLCCMTIIHDAWKITSTPTCPYERLQNDVLKHQGRGAQILLCDDFNARTAEEADFLRMTELQPFLPNTPHDDDLPDDIAHRRKCD